MSELRVMIKCSEKIKEKFLETNNLLNFLNR